MMGLTPRQHEGLVFIRAHVKMHGFPPSLEEIAAGVGFKSKSAAQRIVDALVAAGAVVRVPGLPRAIDLLQTEDHHVPECDCRACFDRRYIAQLKLVQSLKVVPPVAILKARADNFRPLDNLTRLYWQRGFPVSAAPSNSPRVALPSKGGR